MANIVVLVPRLEMMEQAVNVAKQMNMNLQQVRVIDTPEVVSAARSAIQDGANIIVARGLQAELIKRSTNIPVVEIRMTGQELGLLLTRAKTLSGKRIPHIAIIGFENAYSSMVHFEEIFGIRLSKYLVKEIDKIQNAVEQAARKKVDFIIGGDIAIKAAEHLGIPTLFNTSTEESIQEALRIAEKAGYAIDMEKQAASQIDSILETTLDGIIRINTEKKVTAVNQVVRDVLGYRDKELIGIDIRKVMDTDDNQFIDGVLSGEERLISTSAKIGTSQLMVIASPVEIGEKITGCILTLHHMGNVSPKNEMRLHDMFVNGYVAKVNFSHLQRQSEQMKQCMELAAMYSLSKKPMIIYGETGTEKEMFAQAIHNNGARRNHPYVSISCFEATDEKQASLLFGKDNETSTKQDGALLAANFGTLHIAEIHNLSLQCQHRLYKLISQKILIRNDINKSRNVDVRIIASSQKDLTVYVERGGFLPELYYFFQTFAITLPSLRDNPEDIRDLAAGYLKESMERYFKYVVVKENAMKVMMEYDWKGNLIQLQQFCELLVLTAKQRALDEGYIKYMLEKTYPFLSLEGNTEKVTIYKHPNARRLVEVLQKHKGNRGAAAEELGISTTTLWRWMKKYGVGEEYKI